MKAITVLQPWASLLAHGIKNYETRPWRPNDAALGERVAIHAGKSDRGMRIFCDPHNKSAAASYRFRAGLEIGLPLAADLPFGAIIATAELAFAIRTESEIGVAVADSERTLGDWSHGRWAWRLVNPVVLQDPIPCRGSLGLWDVPPDCRMALADPTSPAAPPAPTC